MKHWALHLAVILGAGLALMVLPPYPATLLARVLVLSVQ